MSILPMTLTSSPSFRAERTSRRDTRRLVLLPGDAGGAGGTRCAMTDPMTDERLAQMSIAALSPFPFDHPATQIVLDAFAELIDPETTVSLWPRR